MLVLDVMQWFGALLAVAGALTIACKRPVAGYFVCGGSCVVLIGYFSITSQYGLILMQTGFLIINVIGFFNWSKASACSA